MFAKTDEEKEKHYGKILHASDGTYTNGIMGVLKSVVSLLKKQQPAYVAFVFDKTRDTFRRELYPDYKGTRSRTPEPLKKQVLRCSTATGMRRMTMREAWSINSGSRCPWW